MDVKAEAGDISSDECETEQNAGTSVELQCRQCDDDTHITSSAVGDCCTSVCRAACADTGDCQCQLTSDRCSAACADTGDCQCQLTSCTHVQSLCDNLHSSAEFKDADLVSSETIAIVKAIETEHCFMQSDSVKDDDCSAAGHIQLVQDIDMARAVDSDDHGHIQSYLTSECCQYNNVITADDVTNDEELGQCFTVSSQSQADCSANSLQDAFIQFLKKKQVSLTN